MTQMNHENNTENCPPISARSKIIQRRGPHIKANCLTGTGLTLHCCFTKILSAFCRWIRQTQQSMNSTAREEAAKFCETIKQTISGKRRNRVVTLSEMATVFTFCHDTYGVFFSSTETRDIVKNAFFEFLESPDNFTKYYKYNKYGICEQNRDLISVHFLKIKQIITSKITLDFYKSKI